MIRFNGTPILVCMWSHSNRVAFKIDLRATPFIVHIVHETWQCLHVWCFFNGINQKVWFVMMQFSLHLASMMHLIMKFDSPWYRRDMCWVPPYPSSKVALDWLMACWLKSTNLGMILNTRFGSMGIKRSIWWITLWWLIIEACSFSWILVIQYFTMMWPSFVNLSYFKIRAIFLCMMMSILNTYWETLVT
jgi:hypothetical protein